MQTSIDNPTKFLPLFTSYVTLSAGTYTLPYNFWLYGRKQTRSYQPINCTIDGQTFQSGENGNTTDTFDPIWMNIPANKQFTINAACKAYILGVS